MRVVEDVLGAADLLGSAPDVDHRHHDHHEEADEAEPRGQADPYAREGSEAVLDAEEPARRIDRAAPLSPGSRKHHAAGAIVTTNGGALVGYLVFKNRKEALADLQAHPPNSGPNKVIARSLSGLPKPTYAIRALGNGYVVQYVVFVDGSVVNTWAYGQKGNATERKLLALVEENARWARHRLAEARKTSG